jgi:hypothetical protein
VLAAAVSVAGCGSGGSGVSSIAAPRTGSLPGRLVSPTGANLEGTTIVAESLLGDRTATVRAVTDARDPASRGALLARLRSGGRPQLPGVYTTTAMADGAFLFRDLPPGRYCLTARKGELVGVLSDAQVGGARTASVSVLSLAQAASITGKVRYDQTESPTPDNSGVLAFVRGTSFLGFSQGAGGDYTIPGVAPQADPNSRYQVVAVATGFADAAATLPQPLTGATATAPLIFMTPGASIVGRVIDPSIDDVNKQGLSGATIEMVTGQSTTSGTDGNYEIQGLRPGANFMLVKRSSYRNFRKQVGPLLANTNFFFQIALAK